MENTQFSSIEKPAGKPDLPFVSPSEIDRRRKTIYLSYEQFLRDKLKKLDVNRPRLWNRDYSSIEAYEKSIDPMRERLQAMLGFWIEPDERPSVKTWDEETFLEEKDFIAKRFCLEIRQGLETYGIELIPKTAGPHSGLIVQHGYAGTPELVCGFASDPNREDYSYRSLGLRAVRRGFCVVAVNHPSGYGTTDDECTTLPGHPITHERYGKNRLHRMAIMAGGTLFGLDMLSSSRGVDVLAGRDYVDSQRIGMYGLSQGGQSALYLPALDKRIKASVSSAYFNTRFAKLIGGGRSLSYLDTNEEDKFFPDVIRYFSDCDIVSLIAPRAFAVEAGLKDTSVDFEKSKDEFQRANVHYEKLGIPDKIEFIAHEEGHISATARAFEFLTENVR